MNRRLADIVHHRSVILEIISIQRTQVFEISRLWQKPLERVEVGVKVMQFIYSHRALVASSFAALLAWKRNGIVSLAKKGLRLFLLYPSALSIGLNILSSTFRSSSKEHPNEP